jgi:hypothetical protein
MLKAYKDAKNNKIENISIISEELKACENFKIKFDRNLLTEVKIFVQIYNNTFSDLIEEFKNLLKSINSQMKLVSNNIYDLEVK